MSEDGMTKKERIAELERQIAGMREELDALRVLVWTLQTQQQPTVPVLPTEPQPYPWWWQPFVTTSTITLPKDTQTTFTWPVFCDPGTYSA